MKTIFSSLSVFILFALIVGCTGQNDNFDKYLENGERVYIGKLDSVKVFSGINRFKVRVWSSDRRIERMRIFWGLKSDSVEFEIPPHDRTDSLEFVIDKGTLPLPERDYVLQFVNYDAYGNNSMITEALTNVYGETFINDLYNWRTDVALKSNPITGNMLQITFSPKISNSEYGVYVLYVNKDGNWERKFYTRQEIEVNDKEKHPELSGRTLTFDKNTLPANKEDIRFYMQSVFVPDETCIDSVYMPSKKIESIIKNADLADKASMESLVKTECVQLYPN